jgi:hypothetical protein
MSSTGVEAVCGAYHDLPLPLFSQIDKLHAAADAAAEAEAACAVAAAAQRAQEAATWERQLAAARAAGVRARTRECGLGSCWSAVPASPSGSSKLFKAWPSSVPAPPYTPQSQESVARDLAAARAAFTADVEEWASGEVEAVQAAAAVRAAQADAEVHIE